MKVKELFNLAQGNSFELMNMELSNTSNINFVSRTAQDNGVVAQVHADCGIAPFPAGAITVALGGSVLSAFVQLKPFYTAFHIAVLTPKKELTLQEKLYYCMCISANAYRYNYGRQANKTLKDIDLPDSIPEWVYTINVMPLTTSVIKSKQALIDTDTWKEYKLQDIFDVKYGVNLELQNCEIADSDSENINFVSRTSANNGVVAQVKQIVGKPPLKAGTLSCAGGGTVLSTFVQYRDFYSGRDLYTLTPKYPMSIYSKLFCCTVIEKNKYKFNYGRQANKTLPVLKIKLPCLPDGTPDFDYMEQYIKSLPYADRF